MFFGHDFKKKSQNYDIFSKMLIFSQFLETKSQNFYTTPGVPSGMPSE